MVKYQPRSQQPKKQQQEAIPSILWTNLDIQQLTDLYMDSKNIDLRYSKRSQQSMERQIEESKSFKSQFSQVLINSVEIFIKQLLDTAGKNKIIDLTVIFNTVLQNPLPEYLSILSINKRNIYQFLLNQPQKFMALFIINSLIESKLAAEYFVHEFPDFLNQLITYVIKFKWYCKFEKCNQTAGPRFATIISSSFNGQNLPDLDDNILVSGVSAQILSNLANHSIEARVIIYKRADDLVQCLRDFQIVENYYPNRITYITNILLHLVIKSGFDINKFITYQQVKEFANKVFFNNSLSFEQLSNELCKNPPQEDECFMYDSCGDLMMDCPEFYILKHCTLFLGMFIHQIDQKAKSNDEISNKYILTQKFLNARGDQEKINEEKQIREVQQQQDQQLESKEYKMLIQFQNDNKPLTEQINLIKSMGNYHHQPDNIMNVLSKLDQLTNQELDELQYEMVDLTLISRQYLSLLMVGKRNTFKLLLTPPEKYKSIYFYILLFLLYSRLAVEYFVAEFSEHIEPFIKVATQKFEFESNFKKFESSICPRFATIFESDILYEDLEEEFYIAVCSAQILYSLADHSSQARTIICSHNDKLFQALEEAQTVEIFDCYRLYAIVAILIRLKLNVYRLSDFMILCDFSTRVVFFNNKRTFEELIKEFQQQYPDISECSIYNKQGEIILQDKALQMLKSYFLILGQEIVNQFTEVINRCLEEKIITPAMLQQFMGDENKEMKFLSKSNQCKILHKSFDEQYQRLLEKLPDESECAIFDTKGNIIYESQDLVVLKFNLLILQMRLDEDTSW